MTKLAKERVILITGATSGIGLATARAFAGAATKSQPVRLLLTGRRADRLKRIQKALGSKGLIAVETFAFDVREKRAVEKFASENSGVLSRVDILVNNAGLAAGRDPFPSADEADWETMIDTNVKGLLYVTKRVVPGMIRRRTGHIVNLGSIAGHFAYPNGSVYCATKFAVRAINDGLRMDLLGTNVRVSSIDPGMVETEFSLVRFKGDKAAAKAVYRGMRPLRAEDVASAIVWVTSQPPHVNVQQVILMPTDQASIRDISRSAE